MFVVAIPVITEYGCRIDDPIGCSYTEPILQKQSIGKEAYSATVTISKGVYPDEAVMSKGYFDKIIPRIIISVHEVQQLIHIALYGWSTRW